LYTSGSIYLVYKILKHPFSLSWKVRRRSPWHNFKVGAVSMPSVSICIFLYTTFLHLVNKNFWWFGEQKSSFMLFMIGRVGVVTAIATSMQQVTKNMSRITLVSNNIRGKRWSRTPTYIQILCTRFVYKGCMQGLYTRCPCIQDVYTRNNCIQDLVYKTKKVVYKKNYWVLQQWRREFQRCQRQNNELSWGQSKKRDGDILVYSCIQDICLISCIQDEISCIQERELETWHQWLAGVYNETFCAEKVSECGHTSEPHRAGLLYCAVQYARLPVLDDDS